jgi:hypothetical protein
MYFNTCYHLKLKRLLEGDFEELKQIIINVLDQENQDDKIMAVENSEYNGSGYEFMFLFFDEFKTKKFCQQLDEIGVLYFYKDVTNDLITGAYDSNEDFQKAYFGFAEQKFVDQEFRHLFDFFLMKNRTIDHVMDRIKALGMENIWDIDREILKIGSI